MMRRTVLSATEVNGGSAELHFGGDAAIGRNPERISGDSLMVRVKPACHVGRPGEIAMPSIDQVIVWLVVGLLGGSLAGLIITWDRKGFGLLRNLAVGLAGALVGGLLFRMFGLLPQLDKFAISLRDVVAAVIGSLIVLTGLWLWQRFRSSP
jgi:uncharacterized membrane protein YeaQ/YmgE (transglycosylase-associated protein family)